MATEFSRIKQPEKKSTPKVSIGMPVYNGERLIRKALDSLLAQTFTDFELIISDNASTDATPEICKEYAKRDNRIRFIRQPKNMGATWNFNFVLEQARAEYFMWAACDDIWAEDFIRKCLSCLKQDLEIAVVFSKYCIVSRMYPPLKLRFFPDMSFLSSDDPFVRISQFVLLREPSHKANLIYGIWRKKVAEKLLSCSQDVPPRFIYLGLDIALIVYVLSSSKAFQIPERLFVKTYKRFPPGHVSNVLLNVLMNHGNDKNGKLSREKNIRDHLFLLKRSMELAGIYDERYEEVLRVKYLNDIKKYSGIRGIFNEVVASLRAGIV